jgi:putative ABC transport system substrate-binding protein
MRRREFITLIGSAAVVPLVAGAQPSESMRRVGVLMSTAADDREGQARIAAFRQGLQKLGWIEGQNVRLDIRWGGGDADLDRRFAAELVALTPDVILATASSTVAAPQGATRTVPVVFAHAVDPVAAGFVDSLARPGGNAIGFVLFEYGISAKWLELLKEIAPSVTRAGVLRDPAMAAGTGQFGALQSVAPSFGVELSPVNVRDAGEIERVVTAFARSSNGGLIVTASPLATLHRDLIVALAARHKLCSLQFASVRHRRRLDFLWVRCPRSVAARSRLRRSHLKGREASRPAGTSADQIRDGGQYQDRQGARHHRTAVAARLCRRGHRIAGKR